MKTRATQTLDIAGGVIDLDAGEVRRADGTVRLSATEVRLLHYLVAMAGHPVARDELLTEVWGYDPKVVSRTVDTTVRRLRRKVEPDPVDPVHVVTVYGVGYRWDPQPGAGRTAGQAGALCCACGARLDLRATPSRAPLPRSLR